jgi:hypothetical protein
MTAVVGELAPNELCAVSSRSCHRRPVPGGAAGSAPSRLACASPRSSTWPAPLPLGAAACSGAGLRCGRRAGPCGMSVAAAPVGQLPSARGRARASPSARVSRPARCSASGSVAASLSSLSGWPIQCWARVSSCGVGQPLSCSVCHRVRIAVRMAAMGTQRNRAVPSRYRSQYCRVRSAGGGVQPLLEPLGDLVNLRGRPFHSAPSSRLMLTSTESTLGTSSLPASRRVAWKGRGGHPASEQPAGGTVGGKPA